MPFDHEHPAIPEIPIAAIHIGDRFRRDLGDIDSLAANIAEVGLLHAIVVAPDYRLIAGARRLHALRKLGRTHVPVRIVPIDDIVRGEFAENVNRKDFTPSEMVAIGEAIEPLLRAQAKERQAAAGPTTGKGKKKALRGTSPTPVGPAITSPATAGWTARPTRRRRRSSRPPSASPSGSDRWSTRWTSRAG
jgi:ParB-like chromosome segregation protein Spo0J